MSTQKEILDRFHLINQSALTSIKAFRYFTPDLFVNTGQHPLIVPYVRTRGLDNRNSGAGGQFTTYSIEQLCIVGDYTKAKPGKSMSELMEAIIEDVENTYAGRLRLEHNYEPIVHGHTYNSVSIPRPDPQRPLAICIFQHTVTSFKTRTIGG